MCVYVYTKSACVPWTFVSVCVHVCVSQRVINQQQKGPSHCCESWIGFVGTSEVTFVWLSIPFCVGQLVRRNFEINVIRVTITTVASFV